MWTSTETPLGGTQGRGQPGERWVEHRKLEHGDRDMRGNKLRGSGLITNMIQHEHEPYIRASPRVNYYEWSTGLNNFLNKFGDIGLAQGL